MSLFASDSSKAPKNTHGWFLLWNHPVQHCSSPIWGFPSAHRQFLALCQALQLFMWDTLIGLLALAFFLLMFLLQQNSPSPQQFTGLLPTVWPDTVLNWLFSFTPRPGVAWPYQTHTHASSQSLYNLCWQLSPTKIILVFHTNGISLEDKCCLYLCAWSPRNTLSVQSN